MHKIGSYYKSAISTESTNFECINNRIPLIFRITLQEFGAFTLSYCFSFMITWHMRCSIFRYKNQPISKAIMLINTVKFGFQTPQKIDISYTQKKTCPIYSFMTRIVIARFGVGGGGGQAYPSAGSDQDTLCQRKNLRFNQLHLSPRTPQPGHLPLIYSYRNN